MGFWTASNPAINDSLATSQGHIQSNFIMIEGVLGSNTLSAGITWAQGGLPYAGAVQTIAQLAKATPSAILSNYGASNNPSWIPIANATWTGIVSNVSIKTGTLSGAFIGIVSATAKIYGTWSNMTSNTAFQAGTDGFAIIGATVAESPDWGVYTDSANPPTTPRMIATDYSEHSHHISNITCPVKKGDYWIASVGGATTPSVFWMPMGF